MSSYGLENNTATIAIVASATLAAGATLYLRSGDDGSKKPLKLPIIGDIHSSPIDQPLKNWDAWAKAAGPVAATKLMGIVPLVVLNTSQAATELFAKRSAWYSNRPSSVSMEMITGAGPGKSRFTLMHDQDDHLRALHRILSPSLGSLSAPRYQPVMELESTQLVYDLLALCQTSSVVSTRDVYPLFERTQASNILALHYSIRVPTVDDPLYREVIEIQKKVTHLAANPNLPDMMPFLRHLPGFLSPWQKEADALFAEQNDLYFRLLKAGDDSPGWNATKQARAEAAKQKTQGLPDIDLAYTLATSIQGGMETSPRQLLWLIVAALSHNNKDFVTRAQAVLDKVVGRERLPSFSDRPQLGYIDAVVHELMRWRPISPGSIPRRADKADEYDGIKIAKNAIVFSNAYAIGRDPDAFDPAHGSLEDFIPERWLKDSNMDEHITAQGELRNSLPLPVFGQGRRMCLGKRVAIDGSFMQVAAMLWAFDFEMEDKVDLDDMVVTGFMTEPKPFNFRLKARGPWTADVVEKVFGAAEKDLSKIMGTMAPA
ncbi:cytochrome p450 domain-containing protein [Sarocladium implicatum]|nr:cytochrome p450 domain-containing protein [Sarocladium implicatum]